MAQAVDMIVIAIRWLGAVLIGIVGLLVARSYSRAREFRADAEAARLVGAAPMREALESIARQDVGKASSHGPLKTYAAFHIAGPLAGLPFLGTHPPVERRIAALREIEARQAGASATAKPPDVISSS